MSIPTSLRYGHSSTNTWPMLRERAIVLRDDGGATIGEFWDSTNYFAHWETPAKMLAYFNLVGFDQNH